jgi:hypothetical protein
MGVEIRILIFFALDPKTLPKSRNSGVCNSKTGKRVSKSSVIRTEVKPEGKKYLPGRDTQVSYETV